MEYDMAKIMWDETDDSVMDYIGFLQDSLEQAKQREAFMLAATRDAQDHAAHYGSVCVEQQEELQRLREFRDFFIDRCEGLFYQWGMEPVDLFNATKRKA